MSTILIGVDASERSEDTVVFGRRSARAAGAHVVIANASAGDPAAAPTERSHQLDLLVTGSRGHGPLRAGLAGNVSGRVLRSAHCPVIVVPSGVQAPLSTRFDSPTAATV